MLEDRPLSFLGSKFLIETCAGERKLFSELSDWELLNLKPNEVLDIPDRLYQEHGTMSPCHQGSYSILTIARHIQQILVRCDEQVHYPVHWQRRPRIQVHKRQAWAVYASHHKTLQLAERRR